MKEIKFRGRRVDNGEWVYGSLISDRGHIVHSSKHPCGKYAYIVSPELFSTAVTAVRTDVGEVNISNYCYEVDPITVGQYIGIKDADGVEIYEGDIVEYENGNAGYGRPRWQEISRDIIPSLCCHDEYEDNISWWQSGKVIGNIHDN